MDNEKMGIDRLDGAGNWLTWKFQIKQYLEASELFDVVDGTEVAPIAGANNYTTLLAAWKKQDAKARRAISAACKKQPLLQIMNCETANSMWMTLRGTLHMSKHRNRIWYFCNKNITVLQKSPSMMLQRFYQNSWRLCSN